MPDFTNRIESLFAEVAALPIEQRTAYLDQECANAPEIRAQIEGLLRAHDKANHLLDRPVAGANFTAVHVSSTYHPGEVLAGRYKLLEQIGVGGMGAVWMAEQKEPVKRKVAVKLVKAGMDSAQVLARFEAERQALALMDHPNIAKVFDGGMTDQGRPFFVMEFVKGVPLTEYCNEARLSLKERLNLFIPVCQAVQHAHQKGIIHRDLKPSNILICLYDGKPVPKVIDFGLAKAMHQSLTENTIHTAFGMMVGTPLYMSPEQAEHNNLDVDTRTDIYSLGVILYELLTGTTPLEQKQLKEAAYNEILRLIKEVEPPKPSTRLSGSASLPSVAAQRSIEPKQLSKSLTGDLDWIVMKALDKERSRRYETANGLARDVERFLKDEAVEASPPSSSYRLKKVMRKHRTAINTAAAFAAVLLLGTVVSVWLAIRATRAEGDARQALVAEAKQRTLAEKNEQLAEEQRIKAEHARDRTRAALDAMTSTVTEDALTTQTEISDDQKRFLSEVLTYYKQFAGEKVEDEESRVQTASAAYRVGLIELRLGRKEQAIGAFGMARDEYAVLAAKAPANPQYRANLAASHHRLGFSLYELDRYSAAEDQYRKALVILASLNIEFPAVPEYRQDLANCHNLLGNLLKNARNGSAAEEQYLKALAIGEKLVAEFPTIPKYQRDLAHTLNNLGRLCRALGKPSEEQLVKAMTIREKLAADFPSERDYRLYLTGSYLNVSDLMVASKKPAEAMEFCRKALSIQTKLVADFPTVPYYRRYLSTCHNSLGTLLRREGKLPDAEEQYRKSIANWEQLATEFPTAPLYRARLHYTRQRLRSVLNELGKDSEEELDHHRAIALHEKLFADFSTVREYQNELCRHYCLRAQFYSRQGKFTEAISDWERGLEISARAAQKKNLIAAVSSIANADQIEETAADGADGADAKTIMAPVDLAWANFNYGVALLELKKLEEAKSAFDRALALREQALNLDSKDAKETNWLVALCLWDTGYIYFKCNHHQQAADWFGRAIPKLKAFEQQWPGEEVTKKLRSANWYRAVAFGILRRHSEAIEAWDRVIELTSPSNRPEVRSLRAVQLARNDKADEAIAEMNELTKTASGNSTLWYNFACVYAVAGNKVTEKKQEYLDRAMELLKQAVKAGYKDAAHMKQDSDLDPLRDREDFKQLLSSLEQATTSPAK